MWDGQAAIHGTLQGTKHLVASSGSGKPSVQVAGERARLTVDALHVELVTGHLHLAFVHLIQAELVKQLRVTSNSRSTPATAELISFRVACAHRGAGTYSTGQQQTGGVGGCVVRQANGDPVLWQLVRVGSTHDHVSLNLGVGDLQRNHK